MEIGKKITIYLTSGAPKGVREVRIDQWSGKAVCGPRSSLSDILVLPEIDSAVCLYFLAGPSDQGGLLDVYVGEAGSFKERIKNHDYKKEWWEEVVVFVSQDKSLTKAGVQYLESICIERLGRIGKCDLKNRNNPALPTMPREDISGLEMFYENISTIMPLLGYDIFVKDYPSADRPIKYPDFFCSTGNGGSAKGELTEEGKIRVSKGTRIRKEETQSFQTHPYKKLRSELIKKGRLVEYGEEYVFSDDYVFNSPSAAAAVIKGASVSGSVEWKTKEGKTLKDLLESEIEN